MLRILYVEDNEDNAYMLKMRLELTDEFEVLVAEDGEKGCEIAAAKRPDLILMDLEMPVVDGWEATRREEQPRDARHACHRPVGPCACRRAREGARGFDTKPVEFDRLLGKIRKLFSGRVA